MHPLIKPILAPLLIWQGRQVKKRTPRLLEAEGPRSGRHEGGPRALGIMILGDSAAAGTGVACQEDCLAFQIPKALAPRYTSDWVLEAKSGLTTEQMVARLGLMASQKFDLAITCLGVNDVKAGVSVRAWIGQQKKLVALLKEKFHVSQVIVTAVPPMEKFPALPWPLNWYLGTRAAEMNQALSQWLKKEDDCTFLKIELPFDPGLMAEDKFHPGPDLHRIWGNQAAAAVKNGLGIPGPISG